MTDDKTFSLPHDLRAEVLACAAKTGISLEWLVGLYRRGYNAKMGATGAHPFGRLDADDEGELTVALAVDTSNGVVRLEFGKPVAWLALPASHARELAKLLMQHSALLEKRLS